MDAATHAPRLAAQSAAECALEPLPWFPFDAWASTGIEDAAVALAQRLERAYWRFAAGTSPPPRLTVLILDRRSWPAFAGLAPFDGTPIGGKERLLVPSRLAEHPGVETLLAGYLARYFPLPANAHSAPTLRGTRPTAQALAA